MCTANRPCFRPLKGLDVRVLRCHMVIGLDPQTLRGVLRLWVFLCLVLRSPAVVPSATYACQLNASAKTNRQSFCICEY
jgi:hypothetical protein